MRPGLVLPNNERWRKTLRWGLVGSLSSLRLYQLVGPKTNSLRKEAEFLFTLMSQKVVDFPLSIFGQQQPSNGRFKRIPHWESVDSLHMASLRQLSYPLMNGLNQAAVFLFISINQKAVAFPLSVFGQQNPNNGIFRKTLHWESVGSLFTLSLDQLRFAKVMNPLRQVVDFLFMTSSHNYFQRRGFLTTFLWVFLL